MNSSMINAMVSMNSLQQKLDLIADNMANLDTVGYKKKQASFEELLNTIKQQPETVNQPGRLTPLGFAQGWGSKLTAIQPNLSQGALSATGLPTDFAIEGNALFEVQVDDAGNRAYTRNGAFQLTVRANGDTILTTDDGYPVLANMTDEDGNIVQGSVVLPEGHTLQVDSTGMMRAVSSDGTSIPLGSIRLHEVMRPAALTAVTDNLFIIADGIEVGDVVQAIEPNLENGIALHQGYLEKSNVELTDEIAELIIVQRAYQLAARALSSSDTMMGLANTMRA